jgi:hypothetical protein
MTEQEWISEEIIFDYLEGNLSSEEREAFDLVMNESEVIAHEVKLWKNAYISEPLSNTNRLENSLLIKSNSAGYTPLNRFLSAMAFLLLLTLPSAHFYDFTNEKPVAKSELRLKVSPPTAKEDVDCGNAIATVSKKSVRFENRDVEDLIPLRRASRLEFFVSKPFAMEETPIKEIPIKEIHFGPIKLISEKSLTKTKIKKRYRSLNAQKRKNEIENISSRFLSGREPYVVPLKSANF